MSLQIENGHRMRQLMENGELVIDAELLKEKAFRVGELEFDNENGIGSVPKVADIFWQGLIVAMTPRAFLSLTPRLELSERPKSLPFIESANQPFGTPFLNIRMTEADEPMRVRGHEGRHRMYWIAREYGPDIEIPVALFFQEESYSLRAREIEPEIVESVAGGVFHESTKFFVPGPLFSKAVWSHGAYATGNRVPPKSGTTPAP